MKKVYIAAPFFTPEQLAGVKKVESMLYNLGVEFFSPRLVGVLKDMTEEQREQAAEKVYNQNIFELEACDTILVWVDHKDTGTLFELGFSMAMKRYRFSTAEAGKTIITWSAVSKAVNLMLAYGINYHATNMDELYELLTQLRDGAVNVDFEARAQLGY